MQVCSGETYVQFSASSKSPESSEGGEEREESSILKQIRQLQDLKRMVIQNQSEEGIQYHAGCTAVAALKRNNMLYVANAGDSRGVLCRGGASSARFWLAREWGGKESLHTDMTARDTCRNRNSPFGRPQAAPGDGADAH